MDNFNCSGYVFDANFDSGNLHKVELVNYGEEVEFNLWTKPDCAGTPYENTNRSWFFFSIHGGEPNKLCKLNIVNLNKQVKLFNHGMQPVIRCGEQGKWERIKETPTFKMNEGDFVITFSHDPKENVSTKYYYAFTYPFTYTELQSRLDFYDKKFYKTDDEINEFIEQFDKQGEIPLPFGRSKPMKSETTSPNLDANGNFDLDEEIYYHRELLIESLEHRRIDLLTITSFHNIQRQREYRFKDLFPGAQMQRCHLFNEKKVIFISSRVHPGETPSSFVLNGFLKSILDRKSKIAKILRKMYVFKIVPFLNPDGVFNGFYRSDTLGHNLNRVYITPNIHTQPSIYAVRKLIKYYHDKSLAEEIESCSNSTNQIEIKAVPSTTSEISKMSEDVLCETKSDKEILSSTESTHSSPDTSENANTSSLNCNKFILTVDSCKQATQPIVEKSSKKTMLQSLNETNTRKMNSNQANVSCFGDTRHKTKSHRLNFDRKSTCGSSNSLLGKSHARDRLTKCSNEEFQEKSEIALYMDLHGHASKKGIFMYGNHLPNLNEAVENMLLPRLMSLNCQHFHFDACVFSERNMYQKGKRDGLSKEGSGRVAIYKAIGLVKCYTLESNYNTGKYVNTLPLSGNEKHSKRVRLVPPKYTASIYEEVGRALLPSILDLTESNPISRLRNSEFRTLTGLRDSLRSDVHKLLEPKSASAKSGLTRQKSVYLKSVEQTETTNVDISKENNCQITGQPSSSRKHEKTTALSARKPKKPFCDVTKTSVTKIKEVDRIQSISIKRTRHPKTVLNKKFIVEGKPTDAEKKIRIKRKDPTRAINATNIGKEDRDSPCCSYQLLM